MTAIVTRRATLVAIASVALVGHAEAQDTRAEISTPGGPIGASFLKPEGAGPFPVVLVATETAPGQRTLVADACSRLAKEGFFAVAPDLFAGNPPDATIMQRLDATRDWAGQNGGDSARLGLVGFGPGGRLAWLYDAYSPGLKAVVAWYGPMQGEATLDAAARLHAPLLGLYGKTDGTPQRVLLDAEGRAKKAGKTAEIVVYVGAGTNFAVPGTSSFDQAATLDGWQRTVAWLRKFGVA